MPSDPRLRCVIPLQDRTGIDLPFLCSSKLLKERVYLA